MTYTSFTKHDFAAFSSNDRSGPVDMLNLVKLRDLAIYDDGRNVSGREAYAEYSRNSQAIFTQFGGRIIWRGGHEQTLIGPSEEVWDICFIAQYPSVAAFTQLVLTPNYRAAVKHRQAGVADSRLIRLSTMTPGSQFLHED